MKLYTLLLIVLMGLSTSCHNTTKKEYRVSPDSLFALFEQARWCNGEAYLKLADCYRDGSGLQQNLTNMIVMLIRAKELGAIEDLSDYWETIPANHPYKTVLHVLKLIDLNKWNEAAEIADSMMSCGIVDGYSIKSYIAMEQRDTVEALRLLEYTDKQGSTFVPFLSVFYNDEDTRFSYDDYLAYADHSPIFYLLLGNRILKSGGDRGVSKAIYSFYLRADNYACLDKRSAQWMLDYMNQHKINLPDALMKCRLLILAGKI